MVFSGVCIFRQLYAVCITARHGRSGTKGNGIGGTSREEDEIIRGIFRKSDGVRFSGLRSYRRVGHRLCWPHCITYTPSLSTVQLRKLIDVFGDYVLCQCLVEVKICIETTFSGA